MPHTSFPHAEECPAGARLEGRTALMQSAADQRRVQARRQQQENEPTPAVALAQARRLVVKIGSALLVEEDGEIRRPWLDALVADVARCRARGQELILVSSGAVAVGGRHLGLAGRSLRLEEKQAAAATGQIRLAHARSC